MCRAASGVAGADSDVGSLEIDGYKSDQTHSTAVKNLSKSDPSDSGDS